MKRIIFDTSVYGKLVEDEEVLKKVNEKNEKHEFIIYGAKIIRKDLRAAPKTSLSGIKKLRILLLNLYDKFVSKDSRDLKFNKLVEALSSDYFAEYKRNKGGMSSESIKNVFRNYSRFKQELMR